MKKIFSLILVFICLKGFGQFPNMTNPQSLGSKKTKVTSLGAFDVDSILMSPTGCGSPTLYPAFLGVAIKKVAHYFDSCNHRYWIYDPKLQVWDSAHLGAASGGGTWGTITGTLSDQTDLQTALNLKLNLSDTSTMLSPYLNDVGYGLLRTGQKPYLDSATVFDDLIWSRILENELYSFGGDTIYNPSIWRTFNLNGQENNFFINNVNDFAVNLNTNEFAISGNNGGSNTITIIANDLNQTLRILNAENLNNGEETEIWFYTDSLSINPYQGNINIDSLRNGATYNIDKLMGWGSGNGVVGYVTPGFGINLTSGVLLADSNLLATAYDIDSLGALIGGGADGNGIYTGNGSLSGNTTVTQSTNTLTFNGSTTGNQILSANSSTGTALKGTTTGGGTGVWGETSGNGWGGYFKSATGNGIEADGGTGTAVYAHTSTGLIFSGINTGDRTANLPVFAIEGNWASTNSNETIAQFKRTSSGTVDDNISASIDIMIENLSATTLSNRLTSRLTETTFASRMSELDIDGFNAGTQEVFLRLQHRYIMANNLADTVAYLSDVRAGGGSQTLQQVFDTEVGGSVLTKNDTILLNSYSLYSKGGLLKSDSINLTLQPTEDHSVDSLVAMVSSIEVGDNASPADSAYMYRLAAYYSLTQNNLSQSGRGSFYAASIHNGQVQPGHNVLTIDQATFNDARAGGYWTTGSYKTYRKMMNSMISVFGNQFLKSYANAFGGTGVTRYGSWTAPFNFTSVGAKNTLGGYTQTVNDSITYTFTDSTVLVQYNTADGAIDNYAAFDVYIDNVLQGSYSQNNQTDGITDGVYNNSNQLGTLIITGLTNSSHKIKMVKTDANSRPFAVYLFGHLVDAKYAKPLIFVKPFKLNATGYAVPSSAGPALYTAAISDAIGTSMDSLLLTFPSAYQPYVKMVSADAYFVPATDLSSDSLHPNNQGHRHIAEAIEAALVGIPNYGYQSNGTLTFEVDGYYGSTSGIKRRLAFEDQLIAGGNVIKVGVPANDQLGVWTGDGTIEGPTTLTYSGTQLYNSASAASNSTLRLNSFEFQPWALNNSWIGENIYYNGSSFVRRSTGYTSQIYFQDNEDQFRLGATGAAGTAVTHNLTAKFNGDGTAALGGNISTTTGTYTGASMIVNATRANFGQNVYIGDLTTTPTARLHLLGGTATAGTAPLKINSGTVLGTTEAGAIENDGTHLYVTFSNGGTRYQLDQQGGGGYTTLAQFVGESNWTTGYINGSGDYTALAIGASGKVLTSNGTSSAPSWETPTGANNMATGDQTVTGNRIHDLNGFSWRLQEGSDNQFVVDHATGSYQLGGDDNQYLHLTNSIAELVGLGGVTQFNLVWGDASQIGDIDDNWDGMKLNLDGDGALYLGATTYADSTHLLISDNSHVFQFKTRELQRVQINESGILIPNGIMPIAGSGGTDSVVYRNSSNGQFYLGEATVGGGGYTNLTQFVAQTNWTTYYADGSGGVQELAIGATGKVLTSNGTSSAPSWETPATGVTTFAALTDVNLTSITTNDFLKWDGSDWINRSPAQVRTDLNVVKSQTVNTTDVGNVTTGQDDLMTYSIPAGLLAANGDYIEFTMTFKFASNANSKQVTVQYGAASFYASSAQAQNDGTMEITGKIIRTGATTQRITFSVNSNTVLFQDKADYSTANETLSGAVILKATGEGVSTDDIIQKILTVKFFPAN